MYNKKKTTYLQLNAQMVKICTKYKAHIYYTTVVLFLSNFSQLWEW